MSRSLLRPIIYGLLALCGLVGVVTLVWSAAPVGAPVLHSAPDTATIPTLISDLLNLRQVGSAPTSPASTTWNLYTTSAGLFYQDTSGRVIGPLGRGTHPPVRVATTANITLSGTQTIDGVALTVTTPRTRALVKNQTTASQNGPYTVESGTWLRAADFDETDDASTNSTFYVEAGTTQLGNICRLTTLGPVTFGTTSLTFTCTGSSQVLTLVQQSADPAPPQAGSWLVYTKATGLFTRDSAGNIVGPFGTGSGVGSGTGVGLTARLITTTNISRNGEIVIEGITTNSSRVFVAGQTTPTENGIFITGLGTWTRAADALTGTTFAAGTLVTITDGIAGPTGNAGTTWMYTSSGSYNTGALTAVKTGYGPSSAAFELLTNKNVSYMGLTNGKAPWKLRDSYAAHVALSAATSIDAATLAVSSIGIESATAGNITLSATPRITGCAVGTDVPELTILGLSTTKTVTIPNGGGLLLGGATGSAVVGLPPGGTSLKVRCNSTTGNWEQITAPTLQQVANVSAGQAGGLKDIDGATSAATALRTGDIAGGNYCLEYGNTRECYCSGVLCPRQTLTNPVLASTGTQPTCDATISGSNRAPFWVTSGGSGVADDLAWCYKDAGNVYAWRAAAARGTVTTTIPMPLMTTNPLTSAFVDTIAGTNFPYTGVKFLEAQTGTATYKVKVPANVAAAPAWSIVLTHKALSGTGGDIVLTVGAKAFPTAVTFDVGLVALHTTTTFAVNTSAQTTITTLSSGGYQGTVPIAAGNLLIISISREGGHANDSINADWLILDAALRIDVN